MHQIKPYTMIILSILYGLIAIESNAQDLNDEMKKRLRQTLISPEIQPSHNMPNHSPLKVSPFTRLPTKGDRIVLIEPLDKYQMHLNLDTKTPINQLPAGSVRYECVGGTMMMISTAGQRVSPSGYGRGPIRKKHKRNTNILRAMEK